MGPGLAWFGNVLYAVWKRGCRDGRPWWSTFNGSSWVPQQQIPGVGSVPAVRT
jgi:hypothetical protein